MTAMTTAHRRRNVVMDEGGGGNMSWNVGELAVRQAKAAEKRKYASKLKQLIKDVPREDLLKVIEELAEQQEHEADILEDV